MRPALKRLTLIPFGIALALALLEGGLQLTAWGVRMTTGKELVLPGAGDRLRVVCLGDSNTYGLYLERHESYPGQLETLWAERVGAPALEVLNLGYPGTNSSRLVRDLPEILDRVQPDLVILMVGVNDYWTVPVPLERDAPERSLSELIRRHSKLHRFYLLVRRGWEGELRFHRDSRRIPHEGPKRMEVAGRTFEVGHVRAEAGKSTAGDSQMLGSNLERLIELTRERSVEILLMSYPARRSFYPLANQVIRRAAKVQDVPFVDLTRVFLPLCPEIDCPSVLFRDGHPNAAGYRLVAETLVAELAPRYRREDAEAR